MSSPRPLKIGITCYPSVGGSGIVASALGEELDKLEVRYCANPEANILFGLFGDLPDADTQHKDMDAGLLRQAAEGITGLNRRYGEGRFYLFHREREWVETEGRFIGWERKRGKLEELNRLLNGAPPRGGRKIVHVGDHPVFDYEVPRALGIECYHFNPSAESNGSVINDLRELLKKL